MSAISNDIIETPTAQKNTSTNDEGPISGPNELPSMIVEPTMAAMHRPNPIM